VLGSLAFGNSAAAEQSALAAQLACVQVKGVVVCKVVVQTSGLHRVTWANATIDQLPEFVTVKTGFASYKNDGGNRPNLTFFMLPKRPGKGLLKVRLQASVCPDVGPLCESVNRVLQTVVVVRSE